jgi:nitrogen fixation-related uncharacterized protein
MESNRKTLPTTVDKHKEVLFVDTPDVEKQTILPSNKTLAPKSAKVFYVIVYLIAVSMLAILLSAYYIFFWEAKPLEIDEDDGDSAIKALNSAETDD